MAKLELSDRKAARARQIAYLARYGHQSMLQWDATDVTDLESLFISVGDIVRAENGDSDGK
jgi:hypothetical protein